MKMKRVAILGAVLAIALVAGCHSNPMIQNVSNAPIATTHTMEQIRQAIVAGGTSKGWVMHETQPGVVHGTLRAHSHQADVDVTYSTTSYNINYVSSVGLDYKDGTIHRNYNKWIENLDQAIQIQLSR
jgi:hypothetical protein